MRSVELVKVATFVAASVLTASSVQAYSIDVGGLSVTGEGLTTAVSGATVVDFNSSLVLPAEYVGGAVKNGSSSGNWASPPDDTSNYLTVGPGTGQSSPATISFAVLNQYFGFYAGSLDDYNSIELWQDDTLIEGFSGSDLAALAGIVPNGDQTVGTYWNIWADGISEYFNKVVFISTSNAFETDNHASLAAVPLPAAAWLFGSGLIGLVGLSRRGKKSR
jgi:hypothetical protein